MKYFAIISAGIILAMGSCKNNKTGDVELATDLDSFSYSMGLDYALYMQEGGVKDINDLAVLQGLKDGFSKDSAYRITQDQSHEILLNYMNKMTKESSQEFLAEKEKEAGVQKTNSGLLYKVMKDGTGRTPNMTDTVMVHLEMKSYDGTELINTKKTFTPMEFPVTGFIPGWEEGIQMMKEGEIRTFYIPSDLAFGEMGQRGIRPNTAMELYVELISIK